MDRRYAVGYVRTLREEAERAYAIAEVKYRVQLRVVASMSMQNGAALAHDLMGGLTADERAQVVSREEALLREAKMDMVEKHLHSVAIRAYFDELHDDRHYMY